MKTKAQLEAMTKVQLIELTGRFGKKMSNRNNKAALIKSLLHMQGKTPEPKGGLVTVTVTRCPESGGVTHRVNGKTFNLPPMKPTKLPAWAVPALRAVEGVEFTEE